MKAFMDQNFLLENETAQKLYHLYAKEMPIFDYHNHLSAQEIYENKQFRGITEAWLGFDHYKWRAMRSNGVEEKYITGNASDYEKFEKWALTVPALIGNPLYHWTHLELQRYFDIHEPLQKKNAKDVYDTCNRLLQTEAFQVRNLLKRLKVHTLCTTDDPCDDLHYHKALKDENFEVKVLPTFRADRAIHIEKESFLSFVEELEKIINTPIQTYKQFEEALLDRVLYFHHVGTRFADHGLDEILFLPCMEEEAEVIFQKALHHEELTRDEIRKFQGKIQVALGKCYHSLQWAMQLHIGPMRNNATRRYQSIGADTGFDSMMDGFVAQDLSRFLDALDKEETLPKTIIYCLNPKDNEVISTMLGNFQDGIIPGKIQFGTAWWFNDHKIGMQRQMEVLAATGVLSRFVGMVTDSRSFLSFSRHEYFRRILCNYLGTLIENGEYPNDIEVVGKIVQDICFGNIVSYTEAGYNTK